MATDRYPKKTILVLSQAVIAAAAVGMGAVVILDIAEFWMLLVAAVAQGAAFGFYGPARVAFASDLVGRDQLGNAITLALLSMNGTRVFAPSLAGVLAGIATVGIGGAYLISGVFSVVSLLALIRLPSIAPTMTSSRNPLADITDGIRYVRDRPPLRRLMLCSFAVIMFGFNYVAFLPALVKGVFDLGDGYVGLLSSASSVGAVAVSVPLAKRADSEGAQTIMLGAGLLFGLGVVALGASPNFALAFVVIAIVGAGTTAYQSLSNTLALRMTDDAHQGRVQSLMQLSFAGFGIAALPLGGLAEAIGLRLAIVVMGAIATLAMVLYIVRERGLTTDRAR